VLDQQDIARVLQDGARDALPVLASLPEGAEDEKVERPLQKFGAVGVVLG
jgi:hypothetical protein